MGFLHHDDGRRRAVRRHDDKQISRGPARGKREPEIVEVQIVVGVVVEIDGLPPRRHADEVDASLFGLSSDGHQPRFLRAYSHTA